MSGYTPPIRFTLPYVSKEVSDLLLWRDIKQSAAVFGSVTLGKLLLWWTGASLLNVGIYSVLAVLVGAVLWAQAGGLFASQGPPVPPVLRFGLSDEQTRQAAGVIRPPLNQALATAGTLLSGRDVQLSLKVAGALYVAARIFALISPSTLLYTAFLLAFTLPVAYEQRRSDVDRVVGQAKQQVHQAYVKLDAAVLSKIPKAPKPVAKVE